MLSGRLGLHGALFAPGMTRTTAGNIVKFVRSRRPSVDVKLLALAAELFALANERPRIMAGCLGESVISYLLKRELFSNMAPVTDINIPSRSQKLEQYGKE